MAKLLSNVKGQQPRLRKRFSIVTWFITTRPERQNKVMQKNDRKSTFPGVTLVCVPMELLSSTSYFDAVVCIL